LRPASQRTIFAAFASSSTVRSTHSPRSSAEVCGFCRLDEPLGEPFPSALVVRFRVVKNVRRSFVMAAVAISIVAGTVALWHLRLVVFLFLLGVTWAAAMRPGVERLRTHGIPRAVGVLMHFAAAAGVVALLLWLAVPRAITQLEQAVPTSASEARNAAKGSSGIKHNLFVALQHRLEDIPSGSAVIHPAISLTTKAFEVVFAICFTLATTAYWISERERAQRLVLSLLAPQRRPTVRATWNLIDLKLGAFVRGQLLTITFVSVTLSAAFAVIGLPFWLLLGVFAGIVEIVPVVGPLLAATLAIGAGLTIDWRHAAYAAIAVWGLRLLQDYLINPHVFGHTTGLSPLIILVTVTSIGLLLGGVYVLLSVPLAAILATIIEVAALGRDPEQHPVPRVLLPAKDER
jgi:predicted PurR-regulated permease PerM